MPWCLWENMGPMVIATIRLLTNYVHATEKSWPNKLNHAEQKSWPNKSNYMERSNHGLTYSNVYGTRQLRPNYGYNSDTCLKQLRKTTNDPCNWFESLQKTRENPPWQLVSRLRFEIRSSHKWSKPPAHYMAICTRQMLNNKQVKDCFS